MACGCRRGQHRTRTPIIRPTSTVRSVQGGVAAGPSPSALRAQAMSVTPQPPRNQTGIENEKKQTQSIRRKAILKALGR